MELILFLACILILTYIIGNLLEKIRIPWIFSPLLIGLGLSIYNPFTNITSSPTFNFLAQLGMYLLLFLIGFQLNLKKMFSSKAFILKVTTAIILTEAIVVSILLHFMFDLSWIISLLISLSFATIGEAILLPILDEFKLLRTKLGQTILSIGVVDDIFEILTIILAMILLGYSSASQATPITSILIMALLFLLTFLIVKYKDKITILLKTEEKGISLMFLLLMFIFALFVGIGDLAEAGAIGALFAGIVLRKLTPSKHLNKLHSQIKTLTYGFFAVIFFLWVGLDVNISDLIKYPIYILIITLAAYAAKATVSFFLTKKELGPKKAFLLGISLCVRLSTSIVIIKLLFDNGLIPETVYSILIGTQLIFKFIIPILLSKLITKWEISPQK